MSSPVNASSNAQARPLPPAQGIAVAGDRLLPTTLERRDPGSERRAIEFRGVTPDHGMIHPLHERRRRDASPAHRAARVASGRRDRLEVVRDLGGRFSLPVRPRPDAPDVSAIHARRPVRVAAVLRIGRAREQAHAPRRDRSTASPPRRAVRTVRSTIELQVELPDRVVREPLVKERRGPVPLTDPDRTRHCVADHPEAVLHGPKTSRRSPGLREPWPVRRADRRIARRRSGPSGY